MSAPTQLDPVGTAIDQALRQLATHGPDLAAHANRLGAILWSPPRIVIVGRLKAGKSTLVNALLAAPVAETAALEATNVVTIYQDGAPSRAEVVTLAGRRRELPLNGNQQLAALDIPTTDIAYIHRYLPSHAIRDITLIDTPGLATLTVANESATRRALIDGFEQTRQASVDADAAVFLFDATPRSDEIEFLRKLGFTPLNTLGVLSRADGFGEGVLGRSDPLEHAREHATRLAAKLADSVMTVLPIAGLLAETSHTGRFTEQHARELAALASLSPAALYDLADSDADQPVPVARRDQLIDLVGEYGLVNGRGVARSGAHALNQWLTDHSGIPQLREVLHNSLREYASLHRAYRILTEVENLAYSHPARDHIRGITHQLRINPAVTPVLLFRSLRAMLEADPHSPVVGELMQLLRGATHAQRLGLPANSSPAQIAEAANNRLGWTRQQTMDARSASEEAALADLAHAYTTILSGLHR